MRRENRSHEISDWALLAVAENDIQADLLSSVLEGAGIPTVRRYRGFDLVLRVIMGTVVPVELWVPAAMEREARELLEGAEA